MYATASNAALSQAVGMNAPTTLTEDVLSRLSAHENHLYAVLANLTALDDRLFGASKDEGAIPTQLPPVGRAGELHSAIGRITELVGALESISARLNSRI